MNSQDAFNKTLHRLNYTSGIIKQYTKAADEYNAMQEKFKAGEVLSTRKAKHLKEVGSRKATSQTPLLNNQHSILKGFDSSFTLACKALRKNEKLIAIFYKDLTNKNGITPTFGKDLIKAWEKLIPGAIPPDDLSAFTTMLNDTIEKLKASAPATWHQAA